MLQDQFICQTDPDLWFSDSSSERLYAASLCGNCPFQLECKILGEEEIYGVWGGVDRTGSKPLVKTCRSGRHEKTGPGTCIPCRNESQAKYYKQNAKEINRKKENNKKPKARRNVQGGYCVNGHLLDEDNVTIRSNDQAVLCKKCYAGQKTRDIKALAYRIGPVR